MPSRAGFFEVMPAYSGFILKRSTASRQVLDELNHARQLDLINRDKLPEGYVGPYEYSTNVLAKIRERVRNQMKAEAAAPVSASRPAPQP